MIDAFNRIVIGDCREMLKRLPADIFQCCVTSPPYWGLRDYGCVGQLGPETTPEEYTAHMVEVFQEVRRVLRDDGTLWLNLGDGYARKGKQTRMCSIPNGSNLKPKNLVGIPWMVAFALRADGWYLRSEIIWHKPNPMPESVTDRPTKAHEQIFLLTKSARYFYDADAIKEVAQGVPHSPGNRNVTQPEDKGHRDPGYESFPDRVWANDGKRNARSVWTIPTEPYGGSHFAVMPTALVSRCVLAGSKTGDVVLDPFMGSGTVGQVAESLGRRWFGCELNPEYGKLIAERTAQTGMML